jgi:hypothetical protein
MMKSPEAPLAFTTNGATGLYYLSVWTGLKIIDMIQVFD